ncbi:MAG: hypothetical protein HKN11_09905, partial [Rhizobiales bacterium]|nr:hypothetical protein [Hyphomicrobiales bacterium]
YQGYVVLSFLGQRLMVPFPVPYTEAVVLAQIDRLATDGTIFSDLRAAPFFPSLYPPLFHLFSTALNAVTGAEILAPRLVSMTAFAVIIPAGCGVIAWAGKSTAERLLGVGLFVCLAVTLQPIYELATVGIVDMLAAAFSFSCIVVFIVRNGERLDNSSFAIIAILSSLAFWTKPTALYGPLAVFAFLLTKHAGSAVRLALMGAIGALVSGFALWLYFGTDMLTNVFGYTQTRFAPDRAGYAFAVFWARYLSLALFTVLIAGICLFSRTLGRLAEYEKLALYYLLAASLGFFAAARQGSDWNYMIEFCLALSLATGFAGIRIGTAIENARQGAPASLLRAAAGTGLVLLALSAVPSGRPFKTSINVGPFEIRETLRLKSKLRTGGQRIFSADLGMKMMLGQEIEVEPATVLAMHRTGLWDIAPLTKRIESDVYDCILDHNSALMAHPEMQAVISRFPKSETFARYKLYCK